VAWSEKKVGSSGNFIKWDEPKVIEGRLQSFIHGTYEGKPTIQAAIVGDDGVTRTIKVSTGLQSAGFTQEEIGTRVMVEFEGKGRTAGGKPFNKLSYRVDKGSAAPSPAPAPAAHAAPAQGLVVGGNASEYDKLIAALRVSNPKGASAIEGAMETIYPDPAVRTEKLRETLKQQGVVVA
jgi:hypothetical protein